MKIYLLRHGETAYNVDKRYQGTRDIPLSPKGRDALIPADISPKKVYVSTLCRAVETAKILFPASQLILEADLREMCFGIFEGRNYIEMEKDPEYLAWVGNDCKGRCPGGETREEFTARTCAVFCRLMEEAFREAAAELVIMAHGGTQMALMEQYALPQMDYYHWCGPNGGGYVLTAEKAEWENSRKMRLLGEVRYEKTEVKT
ncbi:histidine phosphatase family protein [Anaerotignum lactatifermentans]|uniref:Histidine phosphatase family protein n=1 Tax=Anaerotignum lactatifermentans TaxID=160404 RepID=A0ABS2GBK4_9FIRM|nr:histidine phosphatase family protein [Anaerotignum lactatifermentans]MBM6829808.1 histidine phosphatase family protein [Anaerotignum lactatifermentans]MBM6878252.1 histidine phosphatase family protein [Anaerotignum lactatifermentans]MBM6951332.1 histidine phosphatase family protein [Anaerotignum lactatifermentans]